MTIHLSMHGIGFSMAGLGRLDRGGTGLMRTIVIVKAIAFAIAFNKRHDDGGLHRITPA